MSAVHEPVPDAVSHSAAELTQVFEERAEHLERDELLQWTAETPRDRELMKKLKGSGAKLLSGPRGSGKSTLLRKAYFELLDEGNTLPAYVNFARSLSLEPLFHKQANALVVFRQWVLYKIITGVYDSYSQTSEAPPDDLYELYQVGFHYIHGLETSSSGELPPRIVAPSELRVLLERWAAVFSSKRCVLLLDDAAHAFSPAQQRDFFEVFRELRSRYVAAKAAVYPGVTSYSPYFHVGHEAELLEAWYSPSDETFLSTMRSVVSKRLPPIYHSRLEGQSIIVDYLALASFGLPRGFLNMLSAVLGVDEESSRRPTRTSAAKAVDAHADIVLTIFGVLGKQLPRYRHFIEIGIQLERSIVETLKTYNRGKPVGRQKTTVIGIQDPVSPELERILAMAEYAGLLRRDGTISKGIKGVFKKYILHYAVVLKENSLSLGKNPSLDDAVVSLSNTSAHAFARSRDSSLLGADYAQRCILVLAPCQRCDTPRPPQEDARFCMKCGAEFPNVSIYEDLLRAPIDHLPLTARRVRNIKRDSTIRTVQDILMDDDANEIKKVQYVGPVWAGRIRAAAEEYVSI